LLAVCLVPFEDAFAVFDDAAFFSPPFDFLALAVAIALFFFPQKN
jgi:hypothetical protein